MQDDDLAKKQLMDMQSALFSLRDGLMNLSLSLRELAFMNDEDGQRSASALTDDLIARLRG
ncbi:MAG: hypothetical protein V4532_07735 [Pseudomonadota bacterium]